MMAIAVFAWWATTGYHKASLLRNGNDCCAFSCLFPSTGVMSTKSNSSLGKSRQPTCDGGNGIMPKLALSSPERWSPQKDSAAEAYLDEQIHLRLIGGRLNHACVMKEMKDLVRGDDPKAYVPSERLVFNYIRRQQDKQKR